MNVLGREEEKKWLVLFPGDVFPRSRDEFIHYTSQGALEGIRQDNWKLLIKKPRAPRRNRPRAQANSRPPQVLLFDLSTDIGESHNLAEAKPEIVKRLTARMEAVDAEITQNARAPWFKE